MNLTNQKHKNLSQIQILMKRHKKIHKPQLMPLQNQFHKLKLILFTLILENLKLEIQFPYFII